MPDDENQYSDLLPDGVKLDMLEKDDRFKADAEKAAENAKPLIERWNREFKEKNAQHSSNFATGEVPEPGGQ